MRRRLNLRRETLAELTASDLTRVAAAAADASGLTCPVRDCGNRLTLTQCFAYSCGCQSAHC